MALADIIERISGDSAAEAAAILESAREQADTVLAVAREQAEREGEATLTRSRAQAEAEAETIRAAARLAARDSLVAARGKLVRSVLEEAAEAVVATPDADYAALLAGRVARVARGDERLLIAEADRGRLVRRLPAAIKKAAGRDLGITLDTQPAGIAHGVVLLGERSKVDLSIDALIDEERDRLSMIAADVLFNESASEAPADATGPEV
jgi:V/A-type H+/Na+-transporting ATPase subunit E